MRAGFEVPLSLESSAGSGDHIFRVNGTLTGAMLLVFEVADGSTLGGGFSAFYGPVHAGALLCIHHLSERLFQRISDFINKYMTSDTGH